MIKTVIDQLYTEWLLNIECTMFPMVAHTGSVTHETLNWAATGLSQTEIKMAWNHAVLLPESCDFPRIQGVMTLTSYERWTTGLADQVTCSHSSFLSLPSKGGNSNNKKKQKAHGQTGRWNSSHEDTADCTGHGGSSLMGHMIDCGVGLSSRDLLNDRLFELWG